MGNSFKQNINQQKSIFTLKVIWYLISRFRFMYPDRAVGRNSGRL